MSAFCSEVYYSCRRRAHLTSDLNRLPLVKKSSGKLQTPKSLDLGQILLHNPLTGLNNGIHSFPQITWPQTATSWYTARCLSCSCAIVFTAIAIPCPCQKLHFEIWYQGGNVWMRLLKTRRCWIICMTLLIRSLLNGIETILLTSGVVGRVQGHCLDSSAPWVGMVYLIEDYLNQILGAVLCNLLTPPPITTCWIKRFRSIMSEKMKHQGSTILTPPIVQAHVKAFAKWVIGYALILIRTNARKCTALRLLATALS